MKKTRLIIALLLVAFLTGCNKEEPPEIEDVLPVYIPEECLKYHFRGTGSYQVYQDSATGVLDSVFITQATVEPDTLYDSSGNLVGIYEYFSYTMQDTSGNSWIVRLPPATANYFGFFNMNRRYFVNGVFQNQINYAFFPHTDTLVTSSQGSLVCADTLTNYLDNGVVYSKVVVFENTSDQQEGGNLSRRYFARNFGLIREEVPASNKVRTLLRSGN